MKSASPALSDWDREEMRWNRWFSRNESKQMPEERSRIDPQKVRLRVEELRNRLVDAGVSAEIAPLLADDLTRRASELGQGSEVALIEGAAIAIEAQAKAQADVERNMRDVREVERLLGAFSGELEKLDEVLEVLSAYAQRMRSNPAKSNRRTLH